MIHILDSKQKWYKLQSLCLQSLYSEYFNFALCFISCITKRRLFPKTLFWEINTIQELLVYMNIVIRLQKSFTSWGGWLWAQWRIIHTVVYQNSLLKTSLVWSKLCTLPLRKKSLLTKDPQLAVRGLKECWV